MKNQEMYIWNKVFFPKIFIFYLKFGIKMYLVYFNNSNFGFHPSQKSILIWWHNENVILKIFSVTQFSPLISHFHFSWWRESRFWKLTRVWNKKLTYIHFLLASKDLTRLKGFSPLAPIKAFGLGYEWRILEIQISKIFEISEMLSIAKARKS